MEKKYEFPTGTLTVSKSDANSRHALKFTLDSISVSINYTYETKRDYAFDNFEARNALVIYNGLLNMRDDL